MPRLLRATLWRTFGLTLVLGLGLFAALLYFPTFAENIGKYSSLVPIPALKDLVGQLEEGGLWAYIAGQHYFKGCNTVGVAAAVLFACGAVAGESQRGTFEIWLARPVTRTRLLLERFFAGAFSVAVPVFASSLCVPAMLKVKEIPIDFDTRLLLLASAHQSLFLLAIYALTFFASTVGTQPTRIAFFVLVFGMVEFSSYMIETLTDFSLFRLSDVDRYMELERSMQLDLRIVLPLLAVTALFAALSVWRFRTRLPA